MKNLPQTPQAKKVLVYAMEEARNLHHCYVGTEHILLSLLREDNVATQVLINLGLKLEDLRTEIVNLLGVGEAGEETDEPERKKDPYAELSNMPPELLQAVKDLDAQFERFQIEKEEAISEYDFERAARLRDQQEKLEKQRQTLIRDWRQGGRDK